MSENLDTIIIGGGQAGLATSYFLKQQGRSHVVLEQAAQTGNAWRTDRWDSFCLLTPNWSFRLPGAEYDGPLPDGYMLRDEIVTRFEHYVERFQLPIRYQTQVTAVDPDPNGQGYRIQTIKTEMRARNVVVATGLFQHPKRPAFSADMSPHITQCDAGQYRNPQSLPAGAVLVVGSAQSGCQIVDE